MIAQQPLFPDEPTHLVPAGRGDHGPFRIALCGVKCRPGGQRDWDSEPIGCGSTKIEFVDCQRCLKAAEKA